MKRGARVSRVLAAAWRKSSESLFDCRESIICPWTIQFISHLTCKFSKLWIWKSGIGSGHMENIKREHIVASMSGQSCFLQAKREKWVQQKKDKEEREIQEKKAKARAQVKYLEDAIRSRNMLFNLQLHYWLHAPHSYKHSWVKYWLHNTGREKWKDTKGTSGKTKWRGQEVGNEWIAHSTHVHQVGKGLSNTLPRVQNSTWRVWKVFILVKIYYHTSQLTIIMIFTGAGMLDTTNPTGQGAVNSLHQRDNASFLSTTSACCLLVKVYC